MATQVKYAVPELQIGNSGVTFTRKTDDGKHGELSIRQNHIEWKPSGNEKVFKVTWKQFADFAEDRKSKHPKATAVKAKKKLKKPLNG